MDKLLGANTSIEQNRVNDYLNHFQIAISQGDIALCIQIARDGVREFPNNFALLNKLMYALFLSRDEDGNIPNKKENMQKYDAEITAIGERIMKYCPDQDIRMEATSRLAFNHCEMGRQEQGRAVYATLPSQQFCRESQIWWVLDNEEKLPFTRNFIRQSYNNLKAGLYNIIYGRLLPDEDLIPISNKMFALDELILGEDATHSRHYQAQCRCMTARIYTRLGKTAEALKQLQIAADYAVTFDNRPEEGKTSSQLLGETNWKRTDFESSDNRSCREIMINKWLAHSDFDTIRGFAAFEKIVRGLS